MKRHWQAVAGLAAGATILTLGAVGASAHTGQSIASASPSSIVTSMRAAADDLLDEFGFERESAGPGVIDDGEGLLSEASISLDQAIQAAQAAYPGELGEVDLEYDQGTLVFNVDVGDQDVNVDADTGAVLGAADD